MPGALAVHPVTPARWDDLARLFEARGSPHHCWCTPYRFREARAWSKAQKREAMERLVRKGTPVGVLAYEDGDPVGWCSVAPRGTYARLERSRTMPRADDAPTWTVLCFFVPRAHRGEGVAQALLAGAVEEARAAGAAFLEGWPHDTAGITATHRGHSRLFEGAGFGRHGARWALDLSR